MSGVFIKDDLRKIKTQKSLLNAFVLLLEKKNFRNITVNDLCEEAYISRSAFYAHYKDKYDLLSFMLDSTVADCPVSLDSFLDIVVYNNAKIIKCILKDADTETFEIVYSFVQNYLNLILQKISGRDDSSEYIVFSNFCIGGVMQHILCSTKNKDSQDIAQTRQYFTSLINYLLKWKDL